jgi:iron(III) transport system ATP-binding protein
MEQVQARGVDVRGVDKAFSDTSVLRSIDLVVHPGQSLALLGPSGCGKTTLLRLIAGLERPDSGEISVGGQVMSSESAWTPLEKRNVGMVFQDWALFPHLTVGRNVGYGLPRAERKGPRVIEALDMVGLADFVDRMPETLSGGQQQRVALARAIAPRPTVLLLDEPFSNLDSALRVGVRSEVHRLLVGLGITSIFVTHDQEEAFVLGDDVAVMQDGRIEQIGSPQDIYRSPSSAWIASFVGEVNMLAGAGEGVVVKTVVGTIPLATPANGQVKVLVRPEDLTLTREGSGTVTLTEYYGHDMMVSVALPDDTELQVRVSARAPWSRGDQVSVSYVGEAANAFV